MSLYYIQDSRSVCGNSAVWWRVDGAGYTSDLDKAWKVGPEWKGRETDVLRLCSEMDAIAQRHVDVQELPRKSRTKGVKFQPGASERIDDMHATVRMRERQRKAENES